LIKEASIKTNQSIEEKRKACKSKNWLIKKQASKNEKFIKKNKRKLKNYA
jgi:hypothetical protein